MNRNTHYTKTKSLKIKHELSVLGKDIAEYVTYIESLVNDLMVSNKTNRELEARVDDLQQQVAHLTEENSRLRQTNKVLFRSKQGELKEIIDSKFSDLLESDSKIHSRIRHALGNANMDTVRKITECTSLDDLRQKLGEVRPPLGDVCEDELVRIMFKNRLAFVGPIDS